MRKLFVATTMLLIAMAAAHASESSSADRPWMDPRLGADERTALVLKQMTLDEKLTLVFGYYSSDAPWKNFVKPEGGRPQAAGYVPGIERLGIPPQHEADAGIGVASQPGGTPTPATSLPSNVAVAASWDPQIAFRGGQMIGSEARALGFNVMLAGGVNLSREPRNGRNFEYGGEDPLLAGTIVGAQVRGIQSNHMISTLKHFALNDQESARGSLSVVIEEQAARQSDLLAFQIALEHGRAGAVMCAYTRVNGIHGCEHPWLLNQVLKKDWGFKGYVMSDWGGVHSTIPAAMAGLDQQSGYPFDRSPYFADALREAVINRHVPLARLDDMAGRILWSMFTHGLVDDPAEKTGNIDFAAHATVSREAAESGIVLLKNARDVLPLKRGLRSVALIGSHADAGVLSGGGASQVYPPAGVAYIDTSQRPGGPLVYHASSPQKALQALVRADVGYVDGTDVDAAVALARRSDVAIVFATQWARESVDVSLALDGEQDALIAAVAKANPNVIVVLETGGAVLMPWLDSVSAVVEAWYPGSSGGEAIARVLTGAANPSGHLPLTFPRSGEQIARRNIDGLPFVRDARPDANYDVDGAAVGYKWFAREQLEPLFPFGHGLSYTRFSQSLRSVQVVEGRVRARVAIRNVGARAGGALAQVYVAPAGPDAKWEAPQRLAGFAKLPLAAGASKQIDIDVDPRLLATYDRDAGKWVIAEGDYELRLATDARTIVERRTVHLARQEFADRPSAGP